MGQKCCWVQATKCQLLVASLFVMLLGLSAAILTIITYYEKRFIVINEVSLEANPIRTFHSLVLYAGICLSSILVIAAILSVVATWRDLESAMAVGFLCFAVVFLASVQAAYWTITRNTEAEDAMMDVYDFVYEAVRSNSSSNGRQELLTIHKTFLCCGKKLPFEEASHIENEMCQLETMGTKEDCLQEIHNFLKKHMSYVSILMIITTIIMVYGMILTSFLCFSIHFKSSLDRKDKYVLAGR
ncbi:tetraspanin-32 [Eublepharis macularius]|uniref:Tetraspanin n=1 Tax=Eublepharis macularius TaxID=481883 RepID=A0AA97IZX6_EUBMA|nr:tetraspanin-32 [Eublepharis macularius]